MLTHWLWLAERPDTTAYEKQILLQHFQSPEEIYYASAAQYRRLEDLRPQAVAALEDKDLTQARALLQKTLEKNIQIVTYSDTAYPAALRYIDDPPMVLYCKGVLPNLELSPAIGVVGTRQASCYGRKQARNIGGQIARCGGVVVSGGAQGIDAEALWGAVDAGKPSVAVMAGGLDKLYPYSSLALFENMLRKGCLISEYPPGTPCFKGNFLRRNRIISAISNGVLVVEAPSRSGALNTARWAYGQGKDLFVLPGAVDSPSCAGSNGLLDEGATAVTSGWKLMEYYKDLYPYTVRCEPEPVTDRPEEGTRAASDKKVIDNPEKSTYSVGIDRTAALDEPERSLLRLLTGEPQGVDQLLAQTDLEPAKVMMLLTKLTVKGFVENHPGRRVSLK